MPKVSFHTPYRSAGSYTTGGSHQVQGYSHHYRGHSGDGKVFPPSVFKNNNRNREGSTNAGGRQELFRAYYSLTAHHSLLTAHYSPLYYSLLTTHCFTTSLLHHFTAHYLNILPTSYLLLTTYYSLLTIYYLLLTTYYLLLTTYYSLLTTYYLLLTTHYLLLTTYYLLLTTDY